MRMVDIIAKKRNGGELNEKEIQYFVDGVVNQTIPDYQISAFLMAVYFKDMSSKERLDLTMKMMQSGDQLNLT